MNLESVTEHKDHFTVVTKEGRSYYLNKDAYHAVRNHNPNNTIVDKMKRGGTERDTLILNGWAVGDIIEGDEGRGPDKIVITAIGEETFLCRWMDKRSGQWRSETGGTTLTCREWKLVDRDLKRYVKNT